jgi:hypothetical protein
LDFVCTDLQVIPHVPAGFNTTDTDDMVKS